MIITRRLAVLAPLWLAACGQIGDSADIEALMRAAWDRPDAPLTVSPIVVERDYAVAGWTQGETGGRALLRKTEGRWSVVLCAGDGIRTASGLQSVGLPAAAARALADQLEAAERDAAPERIAQMARFEGIVRMDGH